MRKFTIFKSLLLLCALVVGGSAWADDYDVTYSTSDLGDMLSGNYTSASDYWKVPETADNTATIAIPIPAQPTSNITITFNIACFGNGDAPSSSNTTITAVGTETGSNWSGSGVSKYPSDKNYVNGVMTITKPDSPTTLGGLTITMGVNSGIKIFRLKSISVQYTYAASAVATPTFSPVGGKYTSNQDVTIACATSGATIRYTTDGSTPTSTSTLYEGPIPVSSTTTIIAKAFSGGEESMVGSATYTIYPVTHAGTALDPYTVTDARNALTAEAIVAETDYYVTGYITKKNGISNKSLTYWLSDDGEMTNTIQCYNGIYIDGADFTDANDLEVGDIATVKGKLTIYSGSTYQFNAGNEVVSITPRTKVNIATFTATTNPLIVGETTATSVTNDQVSWTPASYSYKSDNESIATVDASGVVTAVAKGTANITVTPVVSATDPTYKVGKSKSIEITVCNPSHTATFSVNGVTSEISVEEGEAITFPADPAAMGGKDFVGWAAAAIDGTTDTAPTFVESATMGTADVTYYAVFASETEATGWRKLAASEVSEEGTYALLTTDGHAFNGTINSGHGQVTTDAFSFTNNVATSAPDGTCEITLQAVTGGYKMYNADKGYLYASKAASGGLAWHNSEDSYWSYSNENWEYQKNYEDKKARLRDYNNNSFRTYSTNNGAVLVFAQKTTVASYSAFCTSVNAPVTITSAEYATYCGACALDFSTTGIKAYTAIDNETTVTLNEVTSGKVPANTPVVLYKAGADGTAVDVPVIASADAITGTNDLCVSTGTDVENMYVLSKQSGVVGFYKWAGSVALAAGKIYLQGKDSYTSREFLPFGEATAIEGVKAQNAVEGVYYNLAGQRVDSPVKGLYIVNGKKVMVK